MGGLLPDSRRGARLLCFAGGRGGVVTGGLGIDRATCNIRDQCRQGTGPAELCLIVVRPVDVCLTSWYCRTKHDEHRVRSEGRCGSMVGVGPLMTMRAGDD